jgi:hypothetical protein
LRSQQRRATGARTPQGNAVAITYLSMTLA